MNKNSIKIFEIKERNELILQNLLMIWEDSVKATHLFLSNNEINNIKKYVLPALENVPVLLGVKNKDDELVGFMGIGNNVLEMLFLSNKSRGQGIGRIFLDYGIRKYLINELTVNEQNISARKFYENMEFEVYKRTQLDEQGNPYPLLYMKKKN